MTAERVLPENLDVNDAKTFNLVVEITKPGEVPEPLKAKLSHHESTLAATWIEFQTPEGYYAIAELVPERYRYSPLRRVMVPDGWDKAKIRRNGHDS